MLEQCDSLRQCERMLRQQLSGALLVGELNLSSLDVDMLQQWLVGIFERGRFTDQLRHVRREFPTVLVAFLVGKAIYDYAKESGDYWSSIKRASIPCKSYQRRMLADSFRTYLSRNNSLISWEPVRANPHVGPILLHSMIPNSCLPDFFDWLHTWLKSREIEDESSALREVRLGREAHEKQKTSEIELKRLRAKRRTLMDRLTFLCRKRRVSEIKREIDCISNAFEIAGFAPEEMPDKPLRYLSEQRLKLQTLELQMAQMRLQQDQMQGSIAGRSIDYQQSLKQLQKGLDKVANLEDATDTLAKLMRSREDIYDKIDSIVNNLELSLCCTSDAKDVSGRIPCYGELQQLQAKLTAISKCLDSKKAFEDAWSAPWWGATAAVLLGAGVVLSTWPAVVAAAVPGSVALAKTRKYLQLRDIGDQIEEKCSALGIMNENSGQITKTTISEMINGAKQMQALIDELSYLDQDIISLDEETAELKRHLEELVGNNIDERDAQEVADILKAEMTKVRARLQTAASVENHLDEIRWDISTMQKRRESLKTEIQHLKKGLIAAGDGDLQAGADKVLRWRKLRKNLNKLEKLLNGDTIATSIDTVDSLKREISNIESVICSKEAEIEAASESEPLRDTKAPVKHLLLHGNTTAEKFLVCAMKLIQAGQKGWEKQEIALEFLPSRVLSIWADWVESFAVDDDGNELRYRLVRPQISFDDRHQSVTVVIPDQKLPAEHDLLSAKIKIEDEEDTLIMVRPLEIYSSDQHLVISGEKFRLDAPASRYSFTLLADGQELRQWHASSLDSYSLWAFTFSSGRQISADIPRRKVWLVMPPGTSVIRPKPEVTGRVRGWNGFTYCSVDLRDSKELIIDDVQGARHGIQLVKRDTLQQPELIGGETKPYIRSMEEDLYIGVPPQLAIPCDSEASIDDYALDVFQWTSSDDQFHFSHRMRLEDTENAEYLRYNDEYMAVEISLNIPELLGSSPLGRYRLRVYKNDGFRGLVSFSVVPNADVFWDEDVYVPSAYAGELAGTFNIEAEQIDFEVDRPQVQVERQADTSDASTLRLKADGLPSRITGELQDGDKNGQVNQVQLSLLAPIVKWCLLSEQHNIQTEWSSEVQELWLDDWQTVEDVVLSIKVPMQCDGEQVCLELEGVGQHSEEQVEAGQVNFRLARFFDSISRADEPCFAFTITCPNVDIKPLQKKEEMLIIRSEWEAENIECIYSSAESKHRLQVVWGEEKGKADCRVCRLWNTDDKQLVKDKEVDEGHRDITFWFEPAELSAGHYRIELAAETEDDMWAAPVTVNFPSEHALNVQDIFIEPESNGLQTGDRITISQAVETDTSTPHTLERPVEIEILGQIVNQEIPQNISLDSVLITQTNEEWYVGRLLESNHPHDDLSLVNPLKIELQDVQVLTIEDARGHGAVYCKACRCLMWSWEAYRLEEQQRGHKNALLFNLHFPVQT